MPELVRRGCGHHACGESPQPLWPRQLGARGLWPPKAAQVRTQFFLLVGAKPKLAWGIGSDCPRPSALGFAAPLEALSAHSLVGAPQLGATLCK